MRLLSWTPVAVGSEELARRQARYDRLSPPSVRVTLRDLGTRFEDAPRALETDADVRASEAAVTAAYEWGGLEDFDALLPDCVLDPAIEAHHLGLPVFGLTRMTATFLSGLGATVGALARNDAIASELDRRLDSYGVPWEPTVVMDLSFDDIVDDVTWREAVLAHAGRLRCDFALNACSAVDLGEPATDTLVVDPTALALRLLGVRTELGGQVA